MSVRLITGGANPKVEERNPKADDFRQNTRHRRCFDCLLSDFVRVRYASRSKSRRRRSASKVGGGSDSASASASLSLRSSFAVPSARNTGSLFSLALISRREPPLGA